MRRDVRCLTWVLLAVGSFGACSSPDGGVAPNEADRECRPACSAEQACVLGSCAAFADGACSAEPAQGVVLREVAAYQAGKVALMLDGVRVAPAARSAPLVAGKDTLIRAWVHAAAGSAPKPISVRLSLSEGESGAVSHTFQKKVVAAAADEAALDSTFNFALDGARITPLTRFALELFDCETSGDGGRVPRFPAQGTEPLQTRELGVLKLRFIPVIANDRSPNVAASRLADYARLLKALYPVSDVVHELGPPLRTEHPIDANGSGWQETLQELGIRHQEDDAPNDVHYFGLLEPAPTLDEYCGQSCVGGIAYVTGPELFNRHSRVAMGLSYGDRRAAESVAHELGHALGATHAPCGGGADEDEAFPYPGGAIGWWGFEYPDTLHDPANSTDIMGYCGMRWISDYTYRRFAERVGLLNASLAVLGRNPVGRFRVVLTNPRGPRWGRSPRAAVEAVGEREDATVLDRQGNVVARVVVFRAAMDLPGHASIMVPEAAPGWHSIVLEGERPIAY